MRVSQITPGRAVSVEVECIGEVPPSPAGEYQTKFDGSLSYGGIEVVCTTARGDEPVSIPALDAVAHCKVDRTCGLHVHVDVRDLDLDQAKAVYRRLIRLQSVLKQLVPPSRRRNRYCRWRSNLAGGTRYTAINFRSYSKFKTIEFRCQSGTTNREKIETWAEICYQLVQWARSEAADGAYAVQWRQFIKLLPASLRAWAIKRRVRLYMQDVMPQVEAILGGETAYAKDNAVLKSLGIDIVLGRQARCRASVPTQGRGRLFGYSPSAVLRRLGQLGFTEAGAAAVLEANQVSVQPSTIRFMLRAGARGQGAMAPVEAIPGGAYVAVS